MKKHLKEEKAIVTQLPGTGLPRRLLKEYLENTPDEDPEIEAVLLIEVPRIKGERIVTTASGMGTDIYYVVGLLEELKLNLLDGLLT